MYCVIDLNFFALHVIQKIAGMPFQFLFGPTRKSVVAVVKCICYIS